MNRDAFVCLVLYELVIILTVLLISVNLQFCLKLSVNFVDLSFLSRISFLCCDNTRSIINTEIPIFNPLPYAALYQLQMTFFHRKETFYMEHKLDNIDRKIIEMLQKNARTPVKEIAKEVFLSSPAVSARIEHLEKNGLITGYHAQINPVFLGYHIKAFINLEVEPNQKKDFYPFIQSIPNVIECNCVTGDYSMLIEVAFRSTMELDHFINELQQFGRTKTQIVFSTSVEHRDLPVE